MLSRYILSGRAKAAALPRAAARDTGESGDRKSHFYDTHCRMSSSFRVKIFTAAHKNSIRRYLPAGETVLAVTRRDNDARRYAARESGR